MSRAEPTSDSAPLFLSDDSEVDGPGDVAVVSGWRREEVEEPGDQLPASGVSDRRALLIVLILCYVNLLNYMDRFTVAG